ncbi:sulfur carrier protein ThiS [Paenibacillus cisolokensis]|uniref:sulfur carrier protein ThiS n=1 Tax=Paenibacillus cisolokensis TaxID=1658519 RepID=UPI003D2A60EB
MELIINGSKRELELELRTLAEVIDKLGLSGKPVVAEVDGEVLVAEQWPAFAVMPGMKIELVHFVGGG